MKKFLALISFLSITQAFAAQQPLILENQEQSCKAEITMDDSNRAHLVVKNTNTDEILLEGHTDDGRNEDRPKDPRKINEYTGYQVHSKFAHKQDVYFASWDGGLTGYPQFYVVVKKEQDGTFTALSEKGGLEEPPVRCDKMVVVQ